MAAKTPKVWLVWRGKTQEPQWKQLPVTDDRLDWHWPHTPNDAVRFILSRRGKTPKWIYASLRCHARDRSEQCKQVRPGIGRKNAPADS